MYLYLSNINSKKRLPIISNENMEINTEKLHVLNEMMNHSVIPLEKFYFFFPFVCRNIHTAGGEQGSDFYHKASYPSRTV